MQLSLSCSLSPLPAETYILPFKPVQVTVHIVKFTIILGLVTGSGDHDQN